MSFPFWTNVLNYTYARGYIRIPIVLSVPILFNKYVLYQYEPLFQKWNAGHNQRDIWDRLEKKVAAEAEE
ncbi:hypothetical protein AGDE_01768 [Angomonas deanei]|uniref:Uncharacterized protein n=1 Tax=Angomonas deanei TaxID=59799 RepID=S9X1E9_9TRYP|nr:hypothetical protein AGDE_08047 [Angomonas deanei]EPY42155.1 hypothetical protein AGDE_01768 [Angomonas deanei]CAD2221617.1 hypothetical protein, conserved [Angomonas deanei]|eukprot:EPY34045.1 hypothetical protein AGDE_08047 [Angomonas deanei]